MTTDAPQISEREREILRLVAKGATNQQIAQELSISVNTVKVHLRNIFGKIGANSRTEATVFAMQMGLVSLPGADPIETVTLPSIAVEDPADEPPLKAEVTPAEPTERVLEQAPVVVSEPISLAPVPRRRNEVWIGVGLAAILLVGLAAWWFTQRQAGTSGSATATAAAITPSQLKTRAPMALPRSEFAVASYDGKVYVIGGRDGQTPSATVQRYDPRGDLWVLLNDKPEAVADVQTAIIGRKLYVPGGETAGGVTNAVQAYDPRGDQWETLPPLPAPRSQYALASVEGRLYLFGGWDGSKICDEVFIFDPDTGKWTEGKSLLTARRNGSATVIDGQVYIVGGEDAQGASRSNERYDPTGENGGAWTSLVPLPLPIAKPAAVPVSTYAFAVFDSTSRQALQYNPSADAWTSLALPSDIGLSDRAVAQGPSIFLFGGDTAGAATTLNEYQSLYPVFIPQINNSGQ